MKKVVILLIALLSLAAFAAGTANIKLNPNGNWTQTLTFSVSQWVKVTWNYDETQVFAVDDTTGIANVGNIRFESNKTFKMYYQTTIVADGGVSDLAVNEVKVGSTILSNDNTNPTSVSTKILEGNLAITFGGDYTNASDDFTVKFDFTFLPL